MEVFDHFFDLINITRESQAGRKAEITEFVIIPQRGFPTAVLNITCLQINLFVTGRFGEIAQKSLIVSVGFIISNFRTQLIP